MHAVADAQKLGETVAFIDAEHALDPEYAKNLGVNIDELLLSQPDIGEQIKNPKDSSVIGNVTKIKVVKNKVAPPFKMAQVVLMYGQGISRTSEVIALGVEIEVIKSPVPGTTITKI